MTDPYEHKTCKGCWIVGKPGSGKSHLARLIAKDINEGVYLKAQNKWWDGYDGERTVILDDLDEGGIGLGHLIKIWADKWACKGETKGNWVHLQHHHFIVTSNYRIEEHWAEKEEMILAILRRFNVVHKTCMEQYVQDCQAILYGGN